MLRVIVGGRLLLSPPLGCRGVRVLVLWGSPSAASVSAVNQRIAPRPRR